MLGWSGSEVAVAIREKPIDNKANESLRALIAESLGLPKSQVEVVSGLTSRHKTIEIAGWSQTRLEAEIGRRFGSPAGEGQAQST